LSYPPCYAGTKKLKHMHESELINKFIELRVQGLSVPKISQQIGVPASTLYDWNERARPRIHKLRLLRLEEAEERILGIQPNQFECLAAYLKAIDKQIVSKIAVGEIEDLGLPELIRLGGSLRRQLHRLKLHVTDPLVEHSRSIYADQTQPIILSTSWPPTRSAGLQTGSETPSASVGPSPSPSVGSSSVSSSMGRDSVEPNPKP
jgi:hypothetical protein